MSINTMNQEQKMKNNTAKAANGAQTTGHQTTGAQTQFGVQNIQAKKTFPSLAELLTPNRQPEAAPTIIAPRVDNIDITIVLGDQKNSHMSFYGGEASVDDPYDWDNGDGDEWEESEDTAMDDLHGAATDEVHDACAACEFTDCQAHPKSNESSPQPKEGSHQSRGTGEQTAATRQPGTMKVTAGDAALEGLPDHFKSFIKLLRDAGLDVEVKKYEQNGTLRGRGENDG